MRTLFIASLIIRTSLLASAQPRPAEVSSSPLTQEQIAVYQAFFADFRRGGTRDAINVADVTEILQPDEGDYSGCMEGFPKSSPSKTVRRLSENFAQQNHLHIVDPKIHHVQDPEDSVRNGQSVASAVESGFESGLLTLSEIIFDANHTRAAFHYSFVCGRLCGHVETVVYEKRHGVWKASKHSCGYGIS